MSSETSVRAALEAYVAGRAPAQGVVPLVAAAFYRKGAPQTRDALRPVMAVIERAAPGAVELVRSEGPGSRGFSIAATERPFPAAYEAELRQAAERALGVLPIGSAEPGGDGPGLLGRLWGAVQRLFTRSAA